MQPRHNQRLQTTTASLPFAVPSALRASAAVAFHRVHDVEAID